MLEVFGRDVPTMAKIDENIMVLSEGEHAAYFWGKTKAAMEKVTKGRKYHSKKELQEKTKKILEKYNVPAKEISKIII
jgi:predicted transcriptional regulator